MRIISNKRRSNFQNSSHRSYKSRINLCRKIDKNRNKSNYNISIFILKRQLIKVKKVVNLEAG